MPKLPEADDDRLDVLRGAEAIGRYVGLTTRAAFHALSKGQLPGRKIGAIWVSTKHQLREHIEGGME
jgi:hypothetical protein